MVFLIKQLIINCYFMWLICDWNGYLSWKTFRIYFSVLNSLYFFVPIWLYIWQHSFFFSDKFFYLIFSPLEGCSTDYTTIINQSDSELLEIDCAFHPTDKYEQIFERKLSPGDIKVLKKYQDRFERVIQNKYGRVYELKGNSFKDSFDNN